MKHKFKQKWLKELTKLGVWKTESSEGYIQLICRRKHSNETEAQILGPSIEFYGAAY